MNKRQLAFSCAIFLTLILAAVFLPQFVNLQQIGETAGQTAKPAEMQSAKITVVRSGLAFDEEGYAPFQTISYDIRGYDNATIDYKFLKAKPESKIYLLAHAAIDCTDCAQFKADLVSDFSKYGIAIKEATPQSLLKLSDSLIIVPTGAYPKAVLDNEAGMLLLNNTILYIGKDIETIMDDKGSVINVQNNASARGGAVRTNQGNVLIFEGTGAISHGRIVFVKGTVNSLGSAKQAADMITEIALSKDYIESTAAKTITLAGKGNTTTIIGNTQADYGHIYSIGKLYKNGLESKGTAWSVEAAPKSGSLTPSQANIFPSLPMQFTYKLNEIYKEPVTLKLALALISKDGPAGKPIEAGIAMARETAFGTINTKAPENPGEYIAVLQDQYGRELAMGILHVYNVSAVATRFADNIAQAHLEIDGKPYDGTAIVWKEGSGQKATVGVTGGRLAVPVKFDSENTVLNIEIQGIARAVQFDGGQENALLQNPAFIAIMLGAGLAIIFYLIFRQPVKKITIVIPEENELSGEIMEVSPQEFEDVFNSTRKYLGIKAPLPLSLDEIWRGFGRHKVKGRETAFFRENVAQVLAHFESEGKVICKDGYCIEKKEIRGKLEISSLVALRQASDALLSHGCNVEFEGDFMPLLKLRGKSACIIALESIESAGSMLKLCTQYKKVIIIAKKEEAESEGNFIGKLKKTKQNEIAKIRLMRKNSKIVFATLDGIANVINEA